MVGDPRAARPLDTLALRLFAWLTLLGAGLLGLALAAVVRLPVGPGGFLLPGTGGRHAIAATVVPVLATSGGALAAVSVAALLLGQRARGRPALSHALRRHRAGLRSSRRPVVILVAGVALLTVALLRR